MWGSFCGNTGFFLQKCGVIFPEIVRVIALDSSLMANGEREAFLAEM